MHALHLCFLLRLPYLESGFLLAALICYIHFFMQSLPRRAFGNNCHLTDCLPQFGVKLLTLSTIHIMHDVINQQGMMCCPFCVSCGWHFECFRDLIGWVWCDDKCEWQFKCWYCEYEYASCCWRFMGWVEDNDQKRRGTESCLTTLPKHLCF